MFLTISGATASFYIKNTLGVSPIMPPTVLQTVDTPTLFEGYMFQHPQWMSDLQILLNPIYTMFFSLYVHTYDKV